MKSWWGRRSLRARLMLIGVTGLALGFMAGGAALVGVLGLALQRAVDAEIDATARSIAAAVEADELPVPLQVPAGDQVQVVDARGRVIAASAEADLLVPIVSAEDLDRLRAGERLTIHGGPSRIYSGPLRVAGETVEGPFGPSTVVVARPMTDAMRGLGLLRTYLLVVFPLLLVASGLVAWRVIGATLRPVESLRRGAEEITGAGPAAAARLPVPASRDEIHRLAVTLNGMLDRLEAGRARQREFVADAAHELRSPLASMRAQLEVARRLGPNADWPAVSDDLLADTTRLSRLVDDLLLLARSGATPAPSRVELVDLQALADDVVRRGTEAAPPGPQPQVEVVDNGPVWTVGAPDELRRVIANLVENAVRYARTGVTVAVTGAGSHVLLTVTDDGPGIPPEHRERVFERFTRLDDSRTADTGGAGLGLAIVRELVRRHDGTVTLRDAGLDAGAGLETDAGPSGAAGPGLRVEVRLPAAAPPVEA